ncbi:MAG TPA: hypothetical protein VIP05_03090, partial [Burkholderiaceae bacterium]
MVAIVSGNSLGLNLTSKGVLGGQGVYGDPTMGQGGEQVYVNASNGNLVLQQLQDQLVGAGLDVASVLTYNSLGLANDDNGDNFSIGKAPVQLQLSGPVNTAGSTLTRTAFDGSQAVYTWDAANSRYIAVNGTGAFDTITYASSKYTWVDGATQTTETYDGTTGRLLTRTDAAGNALTFGYDPSSGFLTSVTDANGETVTYVYSGNLLQQVKAPAMTSAGGTTSVQPVVTYGYDTSGRLATVTVDLTPDGSTGDGNVYTTSYTYDGSSRRVQTVTQSDGTKLTFAYDASNRVYTITDALNNVTTYTYDTANLKTTVTANGQATVYAYNTSGQLLSVTAPAVNGASPVTKFAYNANGELATATDADGRVTTMGYDAAGNQVSVLDSAGNLTTRTFDSKNRQLTQTTALLPTAPGPALSTPALTSAGGVSVAGGVVTKTGSTNAWDAGAWSAIALPGAVTASATANAGYAMFGLAAAPAADGSYSGLDYGFYLSNGALSATSKGNTLATLGSVVAGDRLSVSYDGAGHVNFLKNGLVLFTTAATPTQPLRLDASFCTQGSSLSDLGFGPGSITDQTLVNGGGMAAVATSPGSATLRPNLTSAGVVSISAGSVTKTGTTNGWDAGAWSTTGLSGVATATVTANAGYAMFGLSRTPATNGSYSGLDYGFYLNSGTLVATSFGNTLATLGSYVAGDTLSVSYDGAGHVSFLKNGLVVYSAAATFTQPLFFDSSLCTQGSGFTNALFGAGTATELAPANGSAAASSAGTVTKTAATAAWDSSVYSAHGVTGAAIATVTAGTGYAMFGLNADPTTDASSASIDYEFYLNNGTLVAAASGNILATLGTYSAGDTLGVRYDGSGHVGFIKNGVVLYSTTATVSQPLYFDSSFYSQGASVSNIRFGSAAPTQLTTRYVYSADGKGLLRYAITPEGRVTEYGYNAQGQLASTNEYVKAAYPVAGLDSAAAPSEATMNAWRATQDLTQTQRTDIARDSRQQIASTTTYTATASSGAGAGTSSQTTFVYDPSGRLLQTIKPGSAKTTYGYDGLGRIKTTTDALNRTTTTAYADAAGTITVTYANQLTTTSAYDKDGRLVSTTSVNAGATLAKATVDYDSLGRVLRTTDLTGVSTWYLYDADGRKVAAVDGNGVLTEYVYDNAGLVTETIAYATPINVALLVDGNGKPNNPALSTVRPTFNASTDHRGWTVYDAAGHVSQTIDALGAVTQFDYDGDDRLVSTRTFATKIDVSTLAGSPALQSVAASSADRIARNFYDGDGHLVGALDPDNYLTVYQYDADGQRTVTIRYATQSPAATDQSTLSQLVPASAPNDQRSVTLYDMQGRVTGQVDALGYLTQTFYNPRNTVDHVTRYATSVGTAVAAGTAVDAIKPAATGSDTTTSYAYDADDRVTSRTDPAGIVTTYTYDPNTDALISSTTGSTRPDATTTQTRYDALGRAVATLDGVGSAMITAGMTQAQIDAIWSQYAVKTTYDLAGRRTSTTDALGHTTLFFYDGDGQLRYTVDPLNNVKELRYDAFGQVTTTIAYATAINPSGIGSGGLVTAGLTSAVAQVANAAKDQVSRRVYDTDGRVSLGVDPMGAATSYAYDANGNVTQTRQYANQVPSGGVVQINDPAGSSGTGSAATVLGTFDIGDVLTATVRFKAPSGAGGKMYLGDG